MKPVIFLDRDGVINRYVCDPEFGIIDSPSSPSEFVLAEGVREGLFRLREAGYPLIVVSNQPGIAKGRFSPALLEATTRKMLDDCGGQIDAVYYCLHHPNATVPDYRKSCECRKPKPGLLFQAAHEWDVDLSKSYIIGDGVSDIQAGRAAGCSTIFVGSRKCYICSELKQRGAVPDFFAEDLKSAAEIVTSNLSTSPFQANTCRVIEE